MNIFDMPDEAVEVPEPSAFQEAQRGWHEGAVNQLTPQGLNMLFEGLQVSTVKDALEKIPQLDEQAYMRYLAVLSQYGTKSEEI